jgi:hypothetical protein
MMGLSETWIVQQSPHSDEFRMISNTILITILFLNFSTSKVGAYLDPGTGSYFLQMAIGGIVGGVFILKTFWHSIKNWFQRIIKPKKKNESPDHSVKPPL